MQKVFIVLLLIYTTHSEASFSEKSKEQANALKKGLLSQVQSKMASEGPLKAIEFCHLRALPLTKEMSADGFEVGRTSLKIRNQANAPEDWMKSFLEKAETSNNKEPFKARVVQNHQGKDVFITPLYMAPACLQCHGSPAGMLKDKLAELYPEDQASGYKSGEFRGFVWVKKRE